MLPDGKAEDVFLGREPKSESPRVVTDLDLLRQHQGVLRLFV